MIDKLDSISKRLDAWHIRFRADLIPVRDENDENEQMKQTAAGTDEGN